MRICGGFKWSGQASLKGKQPGYCAEGIMLIDNGLVPWGEYIGLNWI